MKVAIILGTRPEIIKLSPVIRELQKRQIDFFILHTNQHYSHAMDRVFFDELDLPQPRYSLEVHDLGQGAMVGEMLIGIEPILQQERPDWVLVQGDTNTVLSGAIAASKVGIKVGHIEAGLRSYDRSMPEELNRIVVDHLADALFCPTEVSADNAQREGIDKGRIFVTGNTIVDAVEQNLTIAKQSNLATKYKNQEYLLLTMHRPTNVDTQSALSQVVTSLEGLSDALQTPIIFPVHPRTASALKRYKITPDPERIQIIDPVGYLEMLSLVESAKLVITDSGGVQEEACIMRVPCITIRDNTERPETVEVGANIVVGTEYAHILAGAREMLSHHPTWSNPYGEPGVAKAIVARLY